MVYLSDFSMFLGRFHPIFVHLPIGILVLAVLLELIIGKKADDNRRRLIAHIWLLGACSALFTIISGWMLANGGSYQEDTLFWHRWLGIGLTFLAFVNWWLKKKGSKVSYILNYIALFLLLMGGHLGGNLTHGPGYLLAYAPSFVQNLLGAGNPKQETLPQYDNPDSTIIYSHLVRPILERKCMSCHNNDVSRGGLNLITIESLKKGGDKGVVLAAGKAPDSELFNRVTLAQNDRKFMPPKGEPLTYDEINVLEWWINQGASFEDKVSSKEIPSGIQHILLKQYGLNTQPLPYYEKLTISPIADSKLKNIENQGFKVILLSQNNHLLESSYPKTAPLTHQQIQSLMEAKDHITWLNLGNKSITDDMLKVIGQLPNLTRLRLEKNEITDEGIVHLKNLAHLESLNLYATRITDKALEILKGLPELKHVYLWQTTTSREGIEGLLKAKNKIVIDTGSQIQLAQKLSKLP